MVGGYGFLFYYIYLCIRNWNSEFRLTIYHSLPKANFQNNYPIYYFVLYFSELVPEVLDLIIGELQRKVGFEYIRFIFWLKLNAMLEGFAALDSYELFFGDPEGGRGGDFGALLFMLSNGIIGGLIFLVFTLFHINKSNALALFLLILVSFHYPVMFFIPGQFLFALILNLNRKTV